MEDECVSYWDAAGNLLRHLPIPHGLNVCFKSCFTVLGELKTKKCFYAAHSSCESMSVLG